MGTGLYGNNLASVAVSSLTNRNLAVVEVKYEVPSTHYGIAPDLTIVGC
jgi:hypothetical protein